MLNLSSHGSNTQRQAANSSAISVNLTTILRLYILSLLCCFVPCSSRRGYAHAPSHCEPLKAEKPAAICAQISVHRIFREARPVAPYFASKHSAAAFPRRSSCPATFPWATVNDATTRQTRQAGPSQRTQIAMVGGCPVLARLIMMIFRLRSNLLRSTGGACLWNCSLGVHLSPFFSPVARTFLSPPRKAAVVECQIE